MTKNKIVLLITMILISLSSFSQSLTNKSIEELEIMKKEAISSENFELAKKISDEQKSRVSIDDKIIELDKNLKVAISNENFDEADKLKNEIKRLEDKKIKITKLEEEKKAAILLEDFDKVIALDKQINDLKNDQKPILAESKTSPANAPQTTQTNIGSNDKAPNSNGAVSTNNPTSNSSNNSPVGFPTELSPNGDGINDLLVFKNLESFPKNRLYIYNNKNSQVYSTAFYKNNWAGKPTLKEGEYNYELYLLPTEKNARSQKFVGTFNYIKH